LVRQDNGQVLGKGFHPRAGYPHAEVFALFEAAGLVPDGVAAAQEIMRKPQGQEEQGVVEELLTRYAATDGAQKLFGDLFRDTPVTAYVTLEPCCHYGLTPPCALSLAAAQVSRVVVGFRDPNPRVDGGGVKLLRDAGVSVEILADDDQAAAACAALVSDFAKRITPSAAHDSQYDYVTGAMRRSLRALCQNKKRTGTMVEIPWKGGRVETNEDMEASLAALVLPGKWMEQVDTALWKEELVVLRLNAATAKKKGAKLLGERIAGQLRAHVAQTVGHTCLLYRPAMPAVLDLEALVQSSSSSE
jgi:diaminohydroxyphosphoribosylaminopyrimidine deaminase/5-amino-6-(5-phosphoribosylamino)uracil reductase